MSKNKVKKILDISVTPAVTNEILELVRNNKFTMGVGTNSAHKK